MAEDRTDITPRLGRSTAQALALPARWPGQLAVRGVDWRAWIAGNVAREIDQRRLFPWLAVAFGLGIVLFFAAEGRPALWAPVAGLVLCATGAGLARRNLRPMAALLALAAVFAGFAAAVIRTRSV